jgi:hypothetical protein
MALRYQSLVAWIRGLTSLCIDAQNSRLSSPPLPWGSNIWDTRPGGEEGGTGAVVRGGKKVKR